MHAICPTHLNLLGLIILIISDDEYTARTAPLRTFLRHPVAFTHSGLNIFVSIPFSYILSLCSPHSESSWEYNQ
jgi:hypothetical protein